MAGSLVDKEVAAARKEDASRRREAREAGEPWASWDDAEFWRRVARSEGWRESLGNEVRNIIRRPALAQSFKGLVTAGFAKSVVYSWAKVRKWWAGRQKAGKK